MNDEVLSERARSAPEVRGDTTSRSDTVYGKPIHATFRSADELVPGANEVFLAFFRDSPVAMCMSDEDGHFAMVNAAMCQLVQRDEDDLLGRSAAMLTHPDDLDLHDNIPILMASTGSNRVQLDLRYVLPSSATIYVRLVLAKFAGPAGRIWTAGLLQDVTEERLLSARVERQQHVTATLARVARAQHAGRNVREEIVSAVVTVVDASAVALVEADVSSAAVTASRGMTTSATPDRGQAPNLMVRHVSATGQPVFVPDVAQDARVNPNFVRATGARSIYYQPVSIDRDVVAVLVVAWDKPITHMAAEERDVVELLAAETSRVLHSERSRAELERAARTDGLTGLANRRAWSDFVDQTNASLQRSTAPLTIALIDLDDFKEFNDTFGHSRGDKLLVSFANRLRAMSDSGSLAARWGGEEFVITYTGLSAQQVAERLMPLAQGAGLDRSCSIGIVARDDGESLEQAIIRADQALYRAKGAGKARIEMG